MFIVVTIIEMQQAVTSGELKQGRFIFYGPFSMEDEALEYAQTLGEGGVHELVNPVMR